MQENDDCKSLLNIDLCILQKALAINTKGDKFIVAPKQSLNFNNPQSLLHSINIFLEIFNKCQMFTEELEGFVLSDILTLNWRILPPGKWPWEKVQNEVKPLIDKTSDQKQIIIKYRLETISSFNPEFVAIGQAGFSGYLIFGFPHRNLYLLESLYTGNATYIFEEQWEELSKLTKAEILQGNLQKDRIIHREPWESSIRNIMN